MSDACGATSTTREPPGDDVLTAGARRTVPRWLAAPVGVLALIVWAVLAAPGAVVAGHGSHPEPPVHAQYQPVLGRPFF